jgi:perosamine synthetase
MTVGPSDSALALVESCIPPERPVALHEPTFSGNEWAYVKDCLDTGWVSSVGAYVDRFEKDLAAYCEVDHAVAIVNGTAALHMGLLLAGVGRDDEVFVPALTFVATANAVAYCGAEPHFVDVESGSLGIDPAKLADHIARTCEAGPQGCINKATRRQVRALVVMHTFGHPSRMDEIAAVCAVNGIALVEDAAEALGSRIGARHVGYHGTCASLSFNGNKTITTGGGGALLTCDPDLARRAKHLTTTARVAAGWNFEHDSVGYNYRLPNINAALGCAQLELLPELIDRKRALAERYRAGAVNSRGYRFLAEPEGTTSNYWLCALLFDDPHEREAFLQKSNAGGIQTRPPWRAMHELPMFRASPRMDLSATEDLTRRIVNIPSSPRLLV